MIQTTLFNYFTCNGNNSIKQPISNSPLFKQTILNDYFFSKTKKKNLIINYFKQQNIVKREEEEKIVMHILTKK